MTQKIKSHDSIDEALKNYQTRYEEKSKKWWTFVNYKNNVYYTQSQKEPRKVDDVIKKLMIK